MDKALSTPQLRHSRRQPAMAKGVSRIQPAATKPVRTTLAKIRQAVRKSIQERSATSDA